MNYISFYSSTKVALLTNIGALSPLSLLSIIVLLGNETNKAMVLVDKDVTEVLPGITLMVVVLLP